MSDSRNDLYEERVSQAKVVRKIVFFCLIVLIIVGAIVFISAYTYIAKALDPIDEKNPKEIEVTIPIGSSARQIGEILEKEGLVRSATIFRYYVRYKNETGFQAGEYVLSTAMSVPELVAELKEGKLLQEAALTFTVPEGLWLEDVVQIIAENTENAPEDIMEVINDREFVRELIVEFPILSEDILNEKIRYPLEGYLFPAKYEFLSEQPAIEDVIKKMVGQTQKVLDEFKTDIENSDFSVHEILTLASIIEREAKTSEDRYKISGVLHNRLKRNMKLQVDPSVAYALGEHLYMTSFDDLEIDSPYNTYKYEGLPIGPIANPGKDSIRAALQPEESNYLYFYARYNGEIIYSETYEEHNKVHQKYRHEWVEAERENERSRGEE